ncbi:MAG: hypothetical protein JWO35_390 [Candidatus Saccharibacteria bacterium]|nr:hypothetical protein [Candidatus Saccharibacteria bacterium]
MKKQSLDSKTIINRLVGYGGKVRPYSFVLFIVFVVGLYGFVLFKINALVSEQPTDDAVSSQVQAAKVPHFDKAVIGQLKSLQDNSVSVQALFEEARNNPFAQN